MADEQGTGKPDGNYARASVGSAVNGILTNVGSDGRQFVEQTSPPSNPEYGDVYLADGSSWDPDSDGVSGGELVIYNSSGGWTEIVGGL